MRRFFLLLAAAIMAVAAHAQSGSFETATEAIVHMKVGWNLGNTLDAHDGANACPDIVRSETMWGQPLTRSALMTMMRDAGFGAIRIPVTWFPHMDNEGKVDEAWMKRVHEVVDYVLDAGLYCVLNVHHDTGSGDDHWLHANTDTYQQQRARYEYLWRQIANEFSSYGERLLFESYNEMLDRYNSWCFATFARSGGYDATEAADAYEAINRYAQSFVDVVRQTGGNNAHRNLVVNTYGACSGGGTWNAHLKDPLKEMQLPTDPAGSGHLIFQVHAYPNVKNLSSMRTEMDDMFNALNEHLVSKGAPVIIGEWGTANDGETDYDVRRDNVMAFVDYFIGKAKASNMGTFWWMGLTNGPIRSLPAFSQPDLAERIVKAYHGSSFSPVIPELDDIDHHYTISYNNQWSEANLYDSPFQLTTYKGIKVELAEQPAGNLQVKVYGESDNLQQFQSLSQTVSTITFNSSTLGSTVKRITLQYTQSSPFTTVVKRAALIKADGTEVTTMLNAFWGCSVELNVSTSSVPAIHSADSPTDDAVYSLDGRRVSHPKKGVYIRQGKKYVIR